MNDAENDILAIADKAMQSMALPTDDMKAIAENHDLRWADEVPDAADVAGRYERRFCEYVGS